MLIILIELQIHSRKMNVNPDVNFEELARSTDDFNGAQLKAVCVEAGMLALRRDATEVRKGPCPSFCFYVLNLRFKPHNYSKAKAIRRKTAIMTGNFGFTHIQITRIIETSRTFQMRER